MTEPLFPADDGDEPEAWDDAGLSDDDESNDADADDDDDDDEETSEGQKAVFVSTAVPVPLRVERLDDERAPDGSALGAFIGDRLVARCAMPNEAIEHLIALDLFGEPVPLALLAVEEEPGLQCRLFALVPAERIMGDGDEEGPDEPWKASVPSFEDSLGGLAEVDEDDDEGPASAGEDDDDEEEDEDSAVASILLGHIVRFDRDRKFTDDLTAEAVDVLQKIVLGGTLQDANARAVDDLLDSL